MVRPIRPYTFSISDFGFHSLGHLFNKQHNNHSDGTEEYCLKYHGIAPGVGHILAGQNAPVDSARLFAVAAEPVVQALLPGPDLVEGPQHETRQQGDGQVVVVVQNPGEYP